MPYSAVTQPSVRWLRRCGGSFSSTEAAQITRVLPISISAEPSAFARKPGVISRPSGLQYRIMRNGFGKHPGAQDTVEVYYTGKLINGEVFDGTSPGLPASFNITGSGLIQVRPA